MSRQTDADALIAALAEEARRSAGQKPGPQPEELLDYLEGRLSAEDEERVSRQLAADPEAARALLDLADFEAAGAAAGTQPPELAVRAGWRDLKDKLPGAAPRPRRLPPVLSAIAASLLLATLGLGSLAWWQQSELSRPIANVASLELSPIRAGAEKVARAGEPLRLVLAPEERCPSYTAEVEGPGPRDRRTINLRPDKGGNLNLTWRHLKPGSYRLRLSGCEPRRELEDYRFRASTDGG